MAKEDLSIPRRDMLKAAAVGGAALTLAGGIGWYRKHFALDGLAQGEQVEIRFDGAYLITEVWLNGAKLGRHVNGYTGFAFDLTPASDCGRAQRRGEAVVHVSSPGLRQAATVIQMETNPKG